MINANDIGNAFAQRLVDGADTLRDATGALGAIEVPLSEGNTVELGVNPHSGF